jgi:hypothetical protein
VTVANPLLEGWLALKPSGPWGWKRFDATRDDVARAVRILGLDGEFVNIHPLLDPIALRRPACHRYSWAIPDQAALKALVALGPLVEIGAGKGYWAAQVARLGGDVVAYDVALPGPCNVWHPNAGTFFLVRQAGAEVAGQHPDRALFLCWPPYGEDPDPALLALLAYEAAGGRCVAYIGEDDGGCTAGPGFFERLAVWQEVQSVVLPQWPGIHDDLRISEALVRRW